MKKMKYNFFTTNELKPGGWLKKQLEILVGNNGARGYNLGELNKQLCAKIPEFNVKNYGYTKFSRFMENLDGFTVKNNNVFIDNND